MSKVLEKEEVLTLGFGSQTLNGQPYYHTGIDLVGEGYTVCHIKSLMSGHVVDKGYQPNGYGNYIVIDHENGFETRYAHMADPADVNIGDHVEKGQIFGYMGDTGNAFGVHLHFEIISSEIGFRVIDPTDYIFGNKELPGFNPVPQPEPTRKSNEEIAEEVIRGIWGNGDARVQALSQAGYDYNLIQSIVNEKLGINNNPTYNIDDIARRVINGEFGNGQERFINLTNAGYNYDEVQKRVNEML